MLCSGALDLENNDSTQKSEGIPSGTEQRWVEHTPTVGREAQDGRSKKGRIAGGGNMSVLVIIGLSKM